MKSPVLALFTTLFASVSGLAPAPRVRGISLQAAFAGKNYWPPSQKTYTPSGEVLTKVGSGTQAVLQQSFSSGANTGAQAPAKTAFVEADLNKDGVLSFEEFTRWYESSEGGGSPSGSVLEVVEGGLKLGSDQSGIPANGTPVRKSYAPSAGYKPSGAGAAPAAPAYAPPVPGAPSAPAKKSYGPSAGYRPGSAPAPPAYAPPAPAAPVYAPPAPAAPSAPAANAKKSYGPSSGYRPSGSTPAPPAYAPPAPAAPVYAPPAPAAAPSGEHGLGAGGMADTRDPEEMSHEDPRKSISAAPSFEEYLKSREGASAPAPVAAPAAAAPAYAPPAPAAPAAAPSGGHGGIGAGGMADTRDPEEMKHEDPRKSISAAPSFEEYLKSRGD